MVVLLIELVDWGHVDFKHMEEQVEVIHFHQLLQVTNLDATSICPEHRHLVVLERSTIRISCMFLYSNVRRDSTFTKTRTEESLCNYKLLFLSNSKTLHHYYQNEMKDKLYKIALMQIQIRQCTLICFHLYKVITLLMFENCLLMNKICQGCSKYNQT